MTCTVLETVVVQAEGAGREGWVLDLVRYW